MRAGRRDHDLVVRGHYRLVARLLSGRKARAFKLLHPPRGDGRMTIRKDYEQVMLGMDVRRTEEKRGVSVGARRMATKDQTIERRPRKRPKRRS